MKTDKEKLLDFYKWLDWSDRIPEKSEEGFADEDVSEYLKSDWYKGRHYATKRDFIKDVDKIYDMGIEDPTYD